jgi:hypothetical protein
MVRLPCAIRMRVHVQGFLSHDGWTASLPPHPAALARTADHLACLTADGVD